MADLKISALNALSGADLVAADVVAVVDDSASETKKLTVSDLIANGTTLISDATIPSAKILFAAGAIDTAELAASAVETAKINDSAVTAAKLADNSSVTLVSSLPASGDFVGQVAIDTTDDHLYVWDGSSWDSVKAAGSINVVNGSTSGIVNITTSTSGDTVTISTTLDDTSAAKQFLAGPTGAGGTVGYRAIASGDLPTATTSAKGAVAVNGNGLTMNNDEIQIDNSVTAETTEHHLVQYDANGLITAGRVIASSDLPEATSSAKGAVVPGSGLDAAAGGTLNHSNSTTPGTFTKVTVDAQGHVTSAVTLVASDIPELDAAKVTTGTFPTARLADDAVTAAKLADQSVAKFGGAGATDNVVTFPDGDFKGQFFFDEKNEDLYIYTGESFLPITVISGNLVNAGTYNANTNLLTSVTTAGSAAGFTNGAALPNPAAGNLNYYVVVDTSGTGSGNAPAVALAPPDMLISLGVAGTTFQLIDVSNAIAGQTAANISVVATGNIAATDVQAALQELDSEKLAKAGDTMTGNLELGAGVVIVFEGATANDYETTLTVTDPTADRTITLPNETGTVVTTGSSGVVTSTMITDGTIVNADISASAEIAVSKLANGSAHQLLQTDSAGTGVEFTSNVDVPGTLDVTGAATFDSTAAVTGALTVTGVINADGKVKFPAGTAGAPSFYNGTDTDTGLYFSAANEISIATGGTQRVVVDSSGNVGIGTTSPTEKLQVSANALINSGGNGGGGLFVGPAGFAGAFTYKSSGDAELSPRSGYALTFASAPGGTERARIDSSGRLLLGTSTARATGGGQNRYLQVEGTTYATAGLSLTCNSTSNAPTFNFGRSRGTSIGSSAAVQDGDDLGFLTWSAADGTDLVSYAASINAEIDGTPGSNNTPGRLIFQTTASGNEGVSERMRIDSSGNVGIGVTPGTKLHVQGDNNLNVCIIDAQGTAPNYILDVRDDGTSKFRVDGSGNLGINTSSPNKNSWSGPAVTLQCSSNGAYEISDGSTLAAAFALQGDDRIEVINFRSGPLTFKTANTERMRIDSSGNVGIGTSSPSSLLNLSGSLPKITLTSTSTGADSVLDATSSFGSLWIGADQNNEVGSSQIVLAVDGSQMVNIKDTGNVGIGTTSPTSKLEVHRGTISLNATTSSDTTKLRWNYQGTEYQYIERDNATGGLAFGDNTGEQMRLDSSGRLLLGTTTEGNGFADNLTLADSGNCGITIRSGSTDHGSIYFSDATSGGGEFDGYIEYDHTDRFLRFASAATEAMRIDSSGNVGIGITSPQTKFHSSGTTNGAQATFGISSSGLKISTFQKTDNDAGVILDAQKSSNGTLTFATTGTERMRIDSSGNVGIGTASPVADLDIAPANSSATLRVQARTNTSPVPAIELMRGTNTTFGADIYADYRIKNDNAQLVFEYAASGTTTERMRILSSGGLTFNGDTAAANALDDYEEGTWTPAITNTGYTYTYSAQEGTYVKIGKQVTLRWRIVVTARSGSASGGQPIVSIPINTDGSLDGSNFVYSQPAQLVVHKAGTSASSGAKTLLFAGFANSATTYFWINNPTVTTTDPFDTGDDFHLSGVITYDAA